MKIGVVGNGFVGGALSRAFVENYELFVYDKVENRSPHSLTETIESDIVFVCLPTPMKDIEGAEANLSIIHDFFDEVEKLTKFENDTVYVIKSTVPIGTTRSLRERYTTENIIHSPEFLTARCANIDLLTAARHVIGGSSSDSTQVKKVLELYEERFPGSRILTMNSDESEFVKYACNCFFATKVIFFNELKLLSENMEVELDWDLMMKGIISDGRIGQSHHKVPGPDGSYGFGGTCFPKDLNAFIDTFEQNGMQANLLKAVWERNKEIRTTWDWVNNKSAVMQEETK